MTPEEAGQIILEDEQWVDCPACEGAGVIVVEAVIGGRAAMNYRTGKAVPADECWWCTSFGKLINPYYLRACKVAGIVPKPTNWIRIDSFIGRISRIYATKLEVVVDSMGLQQRHGSTALFERGDI